MLMLLLLDFSPFRPHLPADVGEHLSPWHLSSTPHQPLLSSSLYGFMVSQMLVKSMKTVHIIMSVGLWFPGEPNITL